MADPQTAVRVAERAEALEVPPPRSQSLLKTILLRTAFWVGVVDVVLILVFGFTSDDHVFWSVANFQNLSVDAAQIVLLATGVALLLGAGELDISLGANIILSSVIGGKVMIEVAGNPAQVAAGEYPNLALALILGILACAATGAGIGLFNGLVVTKLKVNSFIATLATLGIATGTAFLITNGANLAYIPTALQTDFGVATFAGIPLPPLAVAVVVVLLWVLLVTTKFGLHTLALGSSREAAKRAGLPVDRQLIALFMLVGLMCGLASVIDLSRFATTDIGGHQTDALAAIAGAVIGGTSLFGGRVSIVGAIVGSFLAVILQVGLVIVGLRPFYQLVVVGAVLILAVHVDQRRAQAD